MATRSKESEEHKLTVAIKKLDSHMETLAAHYQPGKYLWMGFLRGIVYGLGILVSVAIIVPILISLLSAIDWIPIIGDIVTDVALRIEAARSSY